MKYAKTLPTIDDIVEKSLSEQLTRVQEVLPYLQFDSSNNLVILKDYSMGAVYRVELAQHEAMLGSNLDELHSNLVRWLQLPNNCALQVLFDQSYLEERDLESKFRNIDPSNSDSLSNLVRLEKLNQIKGRLGTSLFKRSMILSIRYFPENEMKTLRDFLPRKSEALFLDEIEISSKKTNAFLDILSSFESRSPLKLTRLNAQEFIDSIRDLFFKPETEDTRFAKYNNAIELSDQLITTPIKLNRSGRIGEGTMTKTISLKFPGIRYASMAAYFLNLQFPVKLSYRFSFPKKEKVNAFLQWKQFALKNTFSERGKRELEEVKDVQKKLAFDDRCVWVTMSVIVEGKNIKELKQRVNEVQALTVDKYDCNAIVENEIGLSLLWSSLPLNYLPTSDFTTKRYIPLLAKDAAYLLPVFDSFRGGDTPFLVYESREGNLAPYTPFHPKQLNGHMTVLASSGAGKSDFISDVILAAKSSTPEYVIFVIDEKSSLAVMTKLLGGEMNKLEIGKKPDCTPFRGKYDDKKIGFLTNWLCTAIELTSPSFKVEGDAKSIISESINAAINKKKITGKLTYVDSEIYEGGTDHEISISVDDICVEMALLPGRKEFEKSIALIETLLLKLNIFRGEGIYANYFRADSGSQKFTKSFYVFDIEGIKIDPVLRDLTVLGIFEELRQTMMLPENDGKNAILVFDEIASVDRSVPMLSDLIVQSAEKSRKEGFAVIGATNQPESFFQLKGCTALWNISNTHAFMQFDPNAVDKLASFDSSISEADKEIIKSLRTRPGSSADIYIKDNSNVHHGVYTNFRTVVKKVVFPSNPKDAREVNNMIKKHAGNVVKAFNELLIQFKQIEGGI